MKQVQENDTSMFKVYCSKYKVHFKTILNCERNDESIDFTMAFDVEF